MRISTWFNLAVLSCFATACFHAPPLKKTPPPAPIEIKKPIPPPPVAVAPPPVPKPQPVEWSYSGQTGPTYWGLLKPLYVLCNTGKMQSPINLVWKRPQKTGGKIDFHYQAGQVTVVDTGHTLQLNFQPGNFIELDGQRYDLIKGEFHSPSEHTISGNHLSMELELLHENQDGKTAIVSVIFISGDANPALAKIWGQNHDIELNPINLIPTVRTHYSYEGSLTTPPCAENVTWEVFNTPLKMSDDQILAFRRLFPDNSRPTQQLNGRKVVNY